MPRPKPRPFSNEVGFGVRRYLADRDLQMEQFGPGGPKPKLLQVVNKKDKAELRIYDGIGGWFGITASDVAEALDDIGPDKAITVRINSPGGDVFDGVAIFNLLATRDGDVDVVVDGLAASAASFIAQAGTSITMNRGTQMMIHDAIGFTIGNAAVHREQIVLLDRISDEIAGIYAARAGHDVATWREKMLAETWYSAAEAVEAGLADEAADDQVEELEEPDEDGELAAQMARKVAHWRSFTPEELGDQPAAGVSLGTVLAEVVDPLAAYNPAAFALIGDVYADAPATPAVDPGPARPRTAIPDDEFANAIVRGIQEGVRP